MIKILNISQIKELDAFTIKNEPIASLDLMERACTAFVEWFTPRFGEVKSILVVCGTGNNGGDGLGIARQLASLGFTVTVSIIRVASFESPDFKENLERLPGSMVVTIFQFSDTIEFPACDIVIDALFGSGLSRPLEGVYARAVSIINQMDHTTRIAVDIPSGLYADSPQHDGPIVHAHYTVTFQLPKLAFLLPENYQYVGEWHIVNIGLNSAFISESVTRNFVTDEASVKKMLRPRKKYSHKGDFGHSLIIAGSLGKMGANILVAKAALRTGSGLVTSLTPKCGYIALQSAVPEAMVLVDREENFITYVPNLASFTSVAVGPGLGQERKTAEFLSALLSHKISPCVIDADALNILSENQDMQNLILPNSILTPHPGEFRRLVGDWKNDFERLDKQRILSARLKSIIILKGAHTSIAMPDGDVYFNTTGNPAMATGGSGDVLTGILAALLAQRYPPKKAAILGVYLHGLAGDLAAKNRFSIIATDIIRQIPRALQHLMSVRNKNFTTG